MGLVFFFNILLSQLQFLKSKHVLHIIINKYHHLPFHIIDFKHFHTSVDVVESTEVNSKLGQ